VPRCAAPRAARRASASGCAAQAACQPDDPVGHAERYSDPTLLDNAVTLPWLALDGEEHANVIAIDVDHSDIEDRLDALASYGLGRPAAVVDPWSGRSHVVARLRTPVAFTERARLGPQILCRLAGGCWPLPSAARTCRAAACSRAHGACGRT